MRGFAEPRRLTVALCRGRGPCGTRSYSAGIGRGRGEAEDESLLNKPNIASGRGRGRGVGLPFRPVEDSAPGSGSFVANKSVGRGATDQATNSSASIGYGSYGRGSFLQKPSEVEFLEARESTPPPPPPPPPPKPMPSLGLGLGGFGRGKAVQEASIPGEDLLSSERGAVAPKWSKWDETLKRADPKEAPSPAELRLMRDEEAPSTNLLRFPTAPQRTIRTDQVQQGMEMQQHSHPATEAASARVSAQQRDEWKGSLLNLNLSQSSGVGKDAKHGTQSLQGSVESKQEDVDDYNQTFKPVIQPGWYAFAPEKSPLGAGAGRGQTSSPHAHASGIGSAPFVTDESQRVSDQGRGSYNERMEAALQRSSSMYPTDSTIEREYDYPEEPSKMSLTEEEAGQRAMDILNARLSRRYGRMEDWSRDMDDDDKIRRRFPAQLARVAKEPRKQIEALEAAQRKAQLSEEDAKKEDERLKAIEKNEAIEKLKDMWDQFIKSYGEMALEPEHELGDFTNPDINETPMMPLEEYLEKAKPNIMKTGLFTEKQWQRMINEVLQNKSYFEEVVERYSGEGRYTAKQENEDLEEIASTLPSDVGPAAQAFVLRSLTTLKSNPGFNLDEKQWMLAAMVDEFSQYPMTT